MDINVLSAEEAHLQELRAAADALHRAPFPRHPAAVRALDDDIERRLECIRIARGLFIDLQRQRMAVPHPRLTSAHLGEPD